MRTRGAWPYPRLSKCCLVTEPTSNGESEDITPLLIDYEDDRTLRAVLVGMLVRAGPCV
jgi:hypothetical protein